MGLEESLTAAGVVRALRSALYQREPPAGLYFHSDRGSQYSGARVRAVLGSIGAIQSMSGAGHCCDNAVCEAFFSSFKTECLPPEGVFASRVEARRQMFGYLTAYYNTRRLHSSLGYRTPCQFEANWRQGRLEKPLDRADGALATSEDRAPLGSDSSAGAA